MVELSQGRRLGTYQILAPLGAGGMGEVYRAKDLNLGRDVAIKVLPARVMTDPRRLARFKREARLLAALNHPRIGAIYDLEDADDTCFLVLELVEGETLANRIARGPLRINEAVAIALQIGEALDAAHAKGILHRDLKPSNVMLARAITRDDLSPSRDTVRSPSGDVGVKVLDFGLAKATGGPPESPAAVPDDTSQGVVMGTTAYMSPEQARGLAVDARTDTWSLGVVVYEMVTGRLPLAAEEAHAVLYAIIHSAHEPMTSLRVGVPTELDRIVDKALSKSPDERYQHVDELLVDLRRLAKNSSSISTGATLSSATMPKRWQRKWTAVAVAALLLAAIAAVASVWPRDRPPVESRPVRRFSMQLGNVRPVISPNGRHLAFRRDGSLWIRDLESETPREIPGGKASGGYYSDIGYYLTWSPDSQDLVFPAENELRRVSIVQGGSAKTICTLPPGRTTGRQVGGIAWSSDGATIVFSRYDAGVYEVPAGGGSPSLAPDGTFVYLDFGRSLGQFLAWRDRSGSVLSQASEGHDAIAIFSLSPDGNRAVASVLDGGRPSFWLYDVAPFAKTRFDLGSEAEGKSLLGGLWLGDDQIYYTLLTPPSTYQLRAKLADGFGGARAVPFPEGLSVVTDRTRDGRYLVMSHISDSKKPARIWLWRTATPDGSGEAIDFSQNSQAELYSVLSPNERYLAYTSDISERVEVYVRQFPEGPGRWQISSDGGAAPVWGPAGNELFFASGNELMRVRVSTAGPFSVSLPAEPLFSHAPLAVPLVPAPRYAVSPDGKRFLTVERKSEFREPVVRVVENWLAEFRRTLERTRK